MDPKDSGFVFVRRDDMEGATFAFVKNDAAPTAHALSDVERALLACAGFDVPDESRWNRADAYLGFTGKMRDTLKRMRYAAGWNARPEELGRMMCQVARENLLSGVVSEARRNVAVQSAAAEMGMRGETTHVVRVASRTDPVVEVSPIIFGVDPIVALDDAPAEDAEKLRREAEARAAEERRNAPLFAALVRVRRREDE